MDSLRAMEDQKAIQAELPGGESVRWVGRPDPTRLLRRHLPQAAFGVLFGGFAVFWVIGAARGAAQAENAEGMFKNVFPLFGLPFVLVGLSMVLSPLWAWHKGKGTVYAITVRRVVILERHLFGKSVNSYGPDAFTSIQRRSGGGERGDVIFCEEQMRGRRGSTQTKQIGLWGIRDPQHVEREILRLQEEDGG